MFDVSGMIALPIRGIVIVLSITFWVPLIGAIAGTIVTSLGALHKGWKGTGRLNG